MNLISFSFALLMILTAAGSWWLPSASAPAVGSFVAEQPGVPVPARALDELVVHVARYGLRQDEALTGALEPVASSVDLPAEDTAQRIGFLLMRAWPGDEGRELANVTLRYLEYHQRAAVLEAQYDLSRSERLEATQGLQKALFGNHATTMFAQRNQMMRAVLEAMGDDQ